MEVNFLKLSIHICKSVKKVMTLFFETVTNAVKMASDSAFDDDRFIKAMAEKVRLGSDK